MGTLFLGRKSGRENIIFVQNLKINFSFEIKKLELGPDYEIPTKR